MQEIYGEAIAKDIMSRLKNLPLPEKILAAISVGDSPASESFLRKKEQVGRELGVDFRRYNLPADWSLDQLRREVGRIARQRPVGGVLVQLPIPGRADSYYVFNAIPQEKDVDVLGERAKGAFYAGRNVVLPPAVSALREILRAAQFELADKKVAVVGPGELVGRPITLWLLGRVRNLAVVDAGGDFAPLREADLVVSGAGVPGVVKPAMLKSGAGVVDFGYGSGAGGDLKGDFASGELGAADRERLAFFTPTPGGTGPVLVAKLFENFFTLAFQGPR